MKGLITILNQEIKINCLLIALLMTQLVMFARKDSCLFTTLRPTVAPSNRENRHIHIYTLLNKHNQRMELFFFSTVESEPGSILTSWTNASPYMFQI